MKKYGKILTAAVALMLARTTVFLAGCGKKDVGTEAETTTLSDAEQTAAVQAETTAPAVQDETAGETLTQVAVEATQESTEAAVPQTVEEIVEFFNKSANRIKPEASKVTKNYEKRIVDEDQLVFPKSLESAAKGLIDTFMKDDTEPIVYDTREEITTEYIVPEKDYVSRLDPEYVEKATFTDKGDTYEIYIKLKNEKNPVSGEGIGAVCDVIEAHEVAEKASFIEEFSTEYYNCEVKVTVDKATGRVVHSWYSVPLVLKVRVNMFGTHSAEAGLTFVKDYTITY